MTSEESNAREESQHSTEETEGNGFPGPEAGERNSRQTQSSDESSDVTLDVPKLNLEEAHLQVDNLRTRISLQAELADVVKINIGVDTFLEKVELDLKGLEAQAQLKANLENVREILGRTLESLDNNPDLIENLAQSGSSGELEDVPGTARDAFEKRPGEDSEDPEDRRDQEEADERSAGEIEATDAARSKAEELGVDLSRVEGTGSRGRIVARDVLRTTKQA